MTREKYLTTEYKTEQQFTAATYAYHNANYPAYRHLLFHVKNELERLPGESQASHVRRISVAKSMGVLPGVMDLGHAAPYFWIELKLPQGKLSPVQAALHALWQSRGITTYVCYTPHQVCDVFDLHLSSLTTPDAKDGDKK